MLNDKVRIEGLATDTIEFKITIQTPGGKKMTIQDVTKILTAFISEVQDGYRGVKLFDCLN